MAQEMNPSRKLAGKVALITGASSGIGAATAILFSKLGAKLAITGRNAENLAKTAALCGNEPLEIIGNVDKEEDVKRIVEETIKKYNTLDILVNNAGVLELGTIETTSLDQYDRVFNTNVRSVYQFCMLAAPHLIQSKGCIVNVSSVNGIRSFPNVLAYCMSKAALDQLTRCVAIELGTKHVRVNAVNPGVIGTGLQQRSGLDAASYAAFMERSKQTHALGRTGEAEEVAESIAFLASSEASFITGATLPVDGGRHALCPR